MRPGKCQVRSTTWVGNSCGCAAYSVQMADGTRWLLISPPNEPLRPSELAGIMASDNIILTEDDDGSGR